MHEAKILARMQEITIEMQTEKGRKELKDQEKGGSCSTNTQKGPVDHTTRDKVQEEDEVLEPPVNKQETKSEDEGWTKLLNFQGSSASMASREVYPDTQAPPFAKKDRGAYVDTTRDCVRIEEPREVTTFESRNAGGVMRWSSLESTQMFWRATEKNKEAVVNVNELEQPTRLINQTFRTPEAWKGTTTMSRVSGSQSLRTTGSVSSVCLEQRSTTCDTLKTNDNGEPSFSFPSLLLDSVSTPSASSSILGFLPLVPLVSVSPSSAIPKVPKQH